MIDSSIATFGLGPVTSTFHPLTSVDGKSLVATTSNVSSRGGVDRVSFMALSTRVNVSHQSWWSMRCRRL